MTTATKSVTSTKKASSSSFLDSLENLSQNNFSPTTKNSIKIQKELLKRGPDGHFLGGIVHESVRGRGRKTIGNLVHIANPYQAEPIDIITLPTRCTKEEIEEIRKKIIPLEETYEILTAIAKAYEQRIPILIEGDTSIGKTFVVNRFMELLYGPGARPVDFYCSGQTDVSELLGKWAPKTSGLSEHERKLMDEFISSDYGKKQIANIQAEMKEAEDLPQTAQHSLLQSKLKNLLDQVGLNNSVQWEFSYGAVAKAMLCNVESDGKIVIPTNGGSGTILKVDEVGLAEPAVTMALLRIRGEAGKLADSIQLWEAGGEVIHAGSDFFVVYTTNPSDKEYVQRKEIDPALARSVVWLRKGSLSEDSLAIAAQKYLSFSVGNDPGHTPLHCLIDLREESELTNELAELAALVHRRYLELMTKGEPGRRQKLPGSLDHLARLASYLLSNQVLDPNTGLVDFSTVLKRGVEFVYLAGLVDEKTKARVQKELDMLLNDDSIGTKNFRGKDLLRREILELLAQEAETRRTSRRASGGATAKSHDREIYNVFGDSFLSQLDFESTSLVEDLVPQIETALEMFSDHAIQKELLDEIAKTEKPASRKEEEWKEFMGVLTEISNEISVGAS